MVNVEPVLDPDEPVGTLRWVSWTGRDYLHRPPEAAVAPLCPAERLQPPSATCAPRAAREASEASEPREPCEEASPAGQPPEDSPLADDWTCSVARAAEEDECRRQREQRQQPGGSPAGANAGSDDAPPF